MMHINTLDIQARCKALGFDPGPLDGKYGPKTQQAIRAACAARNVRTSADLFHPSGLHRINLHWTAGAYGVIELERSHYHFLTDRNGITTVGKHKPEDNLVMGGGAQHTLNCNTGVIGVAIDAMAGAVEHPFNPGSAPITPAQLVGFCETVAGLCRSYDIPVTPWSVMTHAEVQPTLGIRQRQKWDITWLPGMSAPVAPRVAGDILRTLINEVYND